MPLSTLRNSFRRKNKPQKLKVTEDWISENAQEKQVQRKTSPHNIFSKVGDAKALWSTKLDAYAAKQASNPFSDKFTGPAKMDKNDPNYGRPEANSMTAQRAREGEAKLRQEVCDLCDIIFNLGVNTNEGRSKIQFGELFQIYNGINDKVVGLLLRARKRHLLTFEGEMLFQRRDDDKWITLTKSINSIHVYFGRSPDVTDGGEVENDDSEISKDLKSTSSFTKLNSIATVEEDAIATSSNANSTNVKSTENVLQDPNKIDNNSNDNSQVRNTINHNEIRPVECTIKQPEGEDGSKQLPEAAVSKERKSKLSFRFRKNSSRPTNNASTKENIVLSTSSTELSVNPNTGQRKRSVMAAILDHLPMIPPQHVSTASVNLKKKAERDVESSMKITAPTSRRISFRLKTRRKSEAPLTSAISKNNTKPSEENKDDKATTVNNDSEKDTSVGVQKSKSFDDNMKLTNCVSEELDPETAEANNLSSEVLKEQESNPKANRKVSRKASIAAAAASARHKWEQMKNAAPNVNRMSLKSKSKKEPNKIAMDEKSATVPNVGENNNDLDVESRKSCDVPSNENLEPNLIPK